MKNELLSKGLDFTTLKKQYLEYIDVTPKTVETYNIALRQFGNYMQENEIKTPTREDIINFRESLRDSHTVATVNSYLIALRNFFKFLEYNGIYKNITENVKGLKDTELHKRDCLTIDNCKELLNTVKDLREKALFMLTLACGLRANEIVNIKVEDFKKENDQYVLYVLGKGRDYKQDYVVVPDNVIDVLKEYVKEYDIKDYLFVSTSNHNTGGKLNTCTIRRIINGMYERIGIKTDKLVVHSIRHTMATISIENGEDIRDVSKALRHKSTKTTEVYLHDLEMKNNKCSNTVLNCLLG